MPTRRSPWRRPGLQTQVRKDLLDDWLLEVATHILGMSKVISDDSLRLSSATTACGGRWGP